MLVSVIMPVFNGIQFLQESIDSILNQTHEDFEFIILDDGSTEPVFDLIENCLDTRIVALKNKKNIGLTKSLNICLDKVKGDFVVRHDADDISSPNRIKEQLKLFDNSVGLVGCWARTINKYNEFVKGFVDSCHCSDEDLKTKYRKFPCMADPTSIYSIDAIRKVGYFDERLLLGQTYNYNLRVQEHFNSRVAREVLYLRRAWEGAVGVQVRRKLKLVNKSISWSALAQELASKNTVIK